MARTPAREAMDEAVRLGVAPVLEASGFLRSGATFRRTRERCVQVVNVQPSKWNTARKAEFAVNLGVFFPEVHAVLGELRVDPGPRGPLEHDCTARTRLGVLMPGARDRWWMVLPASSWLRRLGRGNPRRAARKVKTALERFGLPWLERTCDLREARAAALREGNRLSACACSLVLGDRDEARRIADEVRRETPQGTAFLEWARRRGLLA